MTIAKPEWFDYVVWDYSDINYPVMKGFKKDTPKDIIKKFKEDQKRFAEAKKKGIIY